MWIRSWMGSSAAAVVLLCCVGCNVSKHDHQGKTDDVSINTPLGGLRVKTDASDVLGKVGLPQYPGSTIRRDDESKDSADVNLSFGSFHLRVLASGLETADDSAKVEAFYRKALMQYSDVIACRNQQPIGLPAKTGMGLSCSDDKHVHAGNHEHDADRDSLELKAGSPTRQHIVAIDSRHAGTRMELISLELPRDSND